MKLDEYFRNTGVKQVFFAEKIGISTTALRSILKGSSLPSIPTAYAIEKQTDGQVTLYDWIADVDVDDSANVKSRKNKKK